MNVDYKLGSKRVTNGDLKLRFPDWNNIRFEKRVGIKNRYVSDKSSLQLASELNLEEIEENVVLIYVTQTNFYSIPADAFVFAKEKNLDVKDIYQLSSGCSGFVDALKLGLTMSETNSVLIVCSDTYNDIIDQEVLGSNLLFSDCASYVFIPKAKYTFTYYTSLYPEKFSKIHRLNEHGNYFTMDGREVYNFVIEDVLKNLRGWILRNRVDILYLHQANKMMLNHIRKELQNDLPELQIPIMIDDGNTVSSSIPKLIKDSGLNWNNKSIGFCGFGVGLKISYVNLVVS